MAFSEHRQYLIAYDVGDPRRLARLHRYLKAWAIPIQYSVFTASLRHAQIQTLVAGIDEIIHPAQDDVRIYPLPSNPQPIVIGGTVLPDGIHVITEKLELTARTADSKRQQLENELVFG